MEHLKVYVLLQYLLRMNLIAYKERIICTQIIFYT